MVIDSEQDDVSRGFDPEDRQGCGVELRSGADYAVAKALTRLELGQHNGPGGSLPGMYWNNADGLAVRAALLGEQPD